MREFRARHFIQDYHLPLLIGSSKEIGAVLDALLNDTRVRIFGLVKLLVRKALYFTNNRSNVPKV